MDEQKQEKENTILMTWNEIKELIVDVELDVHKGAMGVAAANKRVRKELRRLKSITSDLIRDTIKLEKATKAERKAKLAQADQPKKKK